MERTRPVPEAASRGVGKLHIESLKSMMHSVKTMPRGLYGITSEQFGHTHAESARMFLSAGAEVVQYRGKSADGMEKPVRRMISEAAEVKKLCTDYGSMFIVDDRVDVAAAVEADGVHLGQEDLPIAHAKKQFSGIIGISVSTAEQARKAELDGASYLGAGSVFKTATKADSTLIGVEGLRKVAASVSTPVYAIGGINMQNLLQVKKAGPSGFASISGVLAARDPVAEARKMIELWEA